MGSFLSKSCDDLIGMNLEEAKLYIENNRVYYDSYQIHRIRVTGRDGECFISTADCCLSRINVYIKDSIIINIDHG